MLGQGLNTGQIAAQLVQEFDVTSAQAGDEVDNLLVRLTAEGLLIS